MQPSAPSEPTRFRKSCRTSTFLTSCLAAINGNTSAVSLPYFTHGPHRGEPQLTAISIQTHERRKSYNDYLVQLQASCRAMWALPHPLAVILLAIVPCNRCAGVKEIVKELDRSKLTKQQLFAMRWRLDLSGN